jgi:hypothetical protein
MTFLDKGLVRALLLLFFVFVAGMTLLSCNGGGGGPPPGGTWTRTFGGGFGDRGQTVQQTSDGGYIISGFTYSFGAGLGEAYLVKTDSAGREVWAKTFGGPLYDRGESVQQTSDGGYIVAGWIDAYDPREGDLYLIKTDSSGNKIWDNTFGGENRDMGFDVHQTMDGGYIIVGYKDGSGVSGSDVYLVKADSSGTMVWEKTFGGANPDVGYSVQQTSDGGYILTGRTASFGAGLGDLFLIRTDSSGNETWMKTFGGTGTDGGESVRQTLDGGSVVVGYTKSFGTGGTDVYLIKVDEAGSVAWEKTFGGTGDDTGYDVRQTSDGGYIVCGVTYSFGAGLADVYLIKTDGSGNAVWTKTFGGSANDMGFSLQQTSDGGYIISGYTVSFGSDPDGDVYLIKTDSDGNVTGM